MYLLFIQLWSYTPNMYKFIIIHNNEIIINI